MGHTIRIMFILLIFVSLSAKAEWEPNNQSQIPKVTPAAQRVAEQVDKLPDPLFMIEADHSQVDELLSTTLYQLI